jgi:hypothetical protein
VNDTSCPGGGLLNPLLNLGDTCLGAQVITAGNIANICVQQSGGCCCSPGDHHPLLNLLSALHHIQFALHCRNKIPNERDHAIDPTSYARSN